MWSHSPLRTSLLFLLVAGAVGCTDLASSALDTADAESWRVIDRDDDRDDPPPDYWQWPQKGELDGAISVDGKEYDVDFQDPTNDGSTGVKGEFDGPGDFNGDYSASRDAARNQELTLDASGEGHSVDITISVDGSTGDATASGSVDGTDIRESVTITGTGSSSDPFSVSVGGVSLQWMNRSGSIR